MNKYNFTLEKKLFKEFAWCWKTSLTLVNTYVKLLKLTKGLFVWSVNYNFEINNLDSIKMSRKTLKSFLK